MLIEELSELEKNQPAGKGRDTHRHTAPQPPGPGHTPSPPCKCPRLSGSQHRCVQPAGSREGPSMLLGGRDPWRWQDLSPLGEKEGPMSSAILPLGVTGWENLVLPPLRPSCTCEDARPRGCLASSGYRRAHSSSCQQSQLFRACPPRLRPRPLLYLAPPLLYCWVPSDRHLPEARGLLAPFHTWTKYGCNGKMAQRLKDDNSRASGGFSLRVRAGPV